MGRIRDAQAALLDEESVHATLDLLVAQQQVPELVADELRSTLREMRHDSTYVLGHLGACLGLGGVRAMLPLVPLPLGTLLRTGWVAGARIVETVRGRRDRARIHSFRVFCVAAIPFVGYFAYVLPLRSLHPAAAYLYANHITISRFGQSLEHTLAPKPRIVRRLVSAVVGRPDWEQPSVSS